MVFELLDTSIFDFLKDNEFRPFPYGISRISQKTNLEAVAFFA
jgi:hypothetical protein